MKIKKFKVSGQDALVDESALDGKLLPVPKESDKGKTPVVQEDGSYRLENSGGSGGVNVLTLYLGEKNGDFWAYKDEERTEEYATAEEASNALQNADIVKCISDNVDIGTIVFPNSFTIESNYVSVDIVGYFPGSTSVDIVSYPLYQIIGNH